MDNISGNIVPLTYLDGNLNSSGDEQVVYRGYSAYEIALQQGFEGSKDEWLRALVGPQGETGVSVSDVRLNPDFTLTITLDDGTEFTTESIKGDKGDKGQKGDTGQQGVAGQDGYSPSATVTKVGDTATIIITDKNGTTIAQISDGNAGYMEVDIVNGRLVYTRTDAVDIDFSLVNGRLIMEVI